MTQTVQTIPEQQGKMPKILYENKEKRNAYTKHFVTEGHGGVVAVYPHPVHYEEDGAWKEIDNRLEAEETGESGYQNKAGAMKVKFAKSSNSEKLVTVQKGERKLSWYFLPAQEDNTEKKDFIVMETSEIESCETSTSETSISETLESEASELEKGNSAAMEAETEKSAEENSETEATEISNSAREEENRRKMGVSHARSGGYYEDIVPGMDLRYSLKGEMLKEEVVLKTAEAAKTPVAFSITHKNLCAAQKEDGTICFAGEDGEEVYRLSVPCMYDAEGAYSGDIRYELETDGETSTVTLVPDEAWLADENRVYPVVLDPNVETTKKSTEIADSFIREKYPDSSVVANYGSFYVGNNSDYGMCRAFLKFRTLPTIPVGAVIYNAKIYAWQYKYSTYGESSFYINAHKVTGSWETGSATWNNCPSYESIVQDYVKVEEVESNGVINVTPRGFNVTKLVREWYNTGVNHGIMLKMADESIQAEAVFLTSDYPSDNAYGITSEQFPTGVFYYRDANGLEDYYSYHTQSVGRAGTGYVNDFNGNLVFVHEDMATSGKRMPVKVNHVYNLGRRTEGTRFGWGWRLSACQELKTSDKTDFPYEYIDGDGTSHYFYKDTDDGNKLKDENGLGYVITQESSSDTEAYRIIETKDKYQMIFAQDGFLRKEKDPNGNTITYTYARDTYGLHLSKITDPTGAEITLEYDKNHLVRMTDPAGRVTSYTYETQSDELETYPKRIDTITYPDGKVTTFDYDTDAKTSAGAADRNKLISVRAADGYEINYEYVTDYTVQRVSRITEKNGDSIGQELKISYKNGNTTVFEECGLDGDVDAADDNRACTYQFDNNGRPVCVINNDGTAESFSYYSEGAKNNKLSKSGSTQKTIVNHMRNIRIERALNHWTTCGGDTATVERTEEKGYIGTCSAKITKTGNAGESGIMQDHTLSPGTYTLSAYVCVEELGDGGVFHLTAKGVNTNADGTEEVLNTSSGITARTDNAVDNGWIRESVTFTVDDTHTGVNVYATIGNAVGIAYVTCFQLEEGTVANKFNLLENGSFEKMGDTQDIPSLYNWQETESGDGRVTGDFPSGNCAVHIKGAIGKRKGYYQSISLKADPNMVFSVSGWAKANAIPEQEFRIILGFWFTDGTYFFENIPFNTNITDWQFVHQTVSPHKGKYKDKTLSTLVFYFFYGQNQNDAYFDGFQITCDDEESFVYDDKGNLVSAASAAEKSGFNFDGNDNLSKMTDATGESSEYAYDDKKNLIMAHNSEGVRCRFAYNEYGNPVYSTIQSNSRMGAVTPGRLYYIRERVSGKYLNAKSSGAASGTNCVLDSYSGSSAQKWKAVDAGSGYLKFIPQHADGTALDIVGASNTEGAKAMIATKEDKDSQKFKLRFLKDGSYHILSKCGGDTKGLTNESDLTSDGTAVSIWTTNDTYDRQRWYFEAADLTGVSDAPKAGSVYEIRARHSGQYVQLMDDAATAGTALVQQHYGCKMSQQFLLEDAGEGYFYIRCLHAPELVLAEEGTYNGYYTVTLQEKDDLSDMQKFCFEPLGTGYAIRCKATTRSFDVMGASYAKDGRIIITYGDVAESQWNKTFLLEECSGRIGTSMTYTSDGRNIRTVTDAAGNVTANSYDSNNRLLTSVADAEGNVTSYTYDEHTDQLTSVAMTVDGQEVKNTYTYDDCHRLKTIGHNGFEYTFQYDEFGNRTSVQAADKTLAAYSYLSHNGPLSRLTYGNGDYVDYTYDKEQRIKNLKANGAVICENIYDSDGRLVTQKDTAGDVDYHFNYDLIGRMTAMDTSKGQQLRVGYDDKNRVDSVVQKIDGDGYSVSYLYGNVDKLQKPGLIYGMNVEDTKRQEIEYDLLSRVNKKKILLDGEKAYVTSYTYKDGPRLGTTTSLVESMTSGGTTLSYTYDGCGNITTISEDGVLKTTYHYDALNRLIREDNVWENKTICYVYDLGGNMLSRTEHAYTTGTPGTATKTDTYGYRSSGWKDQLISYNGNTINYDDMGNPKTWRGMNLTWERGRMLKTLTKDGKTFTYTYDASGNRVQKEVDGVTTRYFYNGNKVVGMSITNASGDVEKIHFIYDSNGKLFSMQTATGTYYYLHNLQNDIIGLIDSDGTQVVSYQYGSWGSPMDDGMTDITSEQIGSRNPFRYREYFYDVESDCYYVSSRYYDPEICRFVNGDIVDILVVKNDLYDKNLYVYCDNNPIVRQDEDGKFWVAALVGAAVNVATTYIAAQLTGQEYTLADAGVAALAGAVNSISPLLGGIISGVYTGFMSYQNGASLSEAIFCGTMSGLCTTVSISNLAGHVEPTLNIVTIAVTDFVFGTGYNTVSAATYKATIDNAQVSAGTISGTTSRLRKASTIGNVNSKTKRSNSMTRKVRGVNVKRARYKKSFRRFVW